MPAHPTPDADLEASVAAYRAHALNISAAARALGMHRATMQSRLRVAVERGILTAQEMHEPNAPSRDDYLDARARKLAAYDRRKRKGDWRKPVMVTLPDRPCILVLMGDPHLDADGTDFATFETVWGHMGPDAHGICVGDWFDNWPRALAHLYAEQTIRPADGWLLLDHLMRENGEHLLAACSGNHDDWSHGPVDPVADLMRRHGVTYRQGALRLELHIGPRRLTLAIRHKWQGHSMYSAAHWAARATREGWWDHVMIGGHTHQDEDRCISRADGFIAHAFQLSAFKRYDDYPDVQGFYGRRTQPFRYLVVDPRRADDDPDLVTVRYDHDRARGDLDNLLCSTTSAPG